MVEKACIYRKKAEVCVNVEISLQGKNSFHNGRISNEQDVPIPNIYVPNNIASKYRRQKSVVLQGEMISAMVRDFYMLIL